MFDVVHLAADLFKQVLSGPRLCIPDEKKKKKKKKKKKNMHKLLKVSYR